MKRPSFYEVLAIVVIAIIVFLILRSAIGQVRAVSVRSSCIGNLHKIGTALQMYAKDWGGFAPPYTTTTVTHVFCGPDEPPRTIDFYAFSSVPLLKRCLGHYGASHVWHCPLDPIRSRWGRRTYPPIDHSQTSYYVDARVAIWRPVSIYKPRVVSISKWQESKGLSDLPVYWADTDDVTQGGPYYLECQSSHGGRVGKLILKFDGSVVLSRKGRQ